MGNGAMTNGMAKVFILGRMAGATMGSGTMAKGTAKALKHSRMAGAMKGNGAMTKGYSDHARRCRLHAYLLCSLRKTELLFCTPTRIRR